MITYKKRKNSDKWLSPYVNVALLFLMIGAFAFFGISDSENSDFISEDAQAPTYAITEDVDISGEWVGMMTEDYNQEVRYDYRIVIEQDNSDIEGTTYQESTNYDIEIYAESSVSGDVDGNEIYFYEESTDVLENLSLSSWCRIEVRLSYEIIDGQETLIGTWDSAEEDRAGCVTIDGRVLLTRQAD
ncbi:MAG: hypothetical protein Phog2KO_49880 [Phototrophicaceae bacterium]